MYFSDVLEQPVINTEFSKQHSCAAVFRVVIVSSTQIQTQAESLRSKAANVQKMILSDTLHIFCRLPGVIIILQICC